MNKSERWLGIEEIAQHMGVAPVTIYRWLEKQKIPAHRVGKLWKFKATEVDAWIQVGGAKEPGNRKKRVNDGTEKI